VNRNHRPRCRSNQRQPRSGLTLVEMMVAIMILSIGLLGLASTAGYVVRQVGGGAQQTMAANVIQSRVEWLRSMRCDSIKNGTAVTRGIREKWIRGSISNGVLAVLDSVTYSVAHSNKTEKTQAYVIMVQC
jgi:prepilin-type N-terminal cleavage/methylation domain-containing protein